MNIAQDVKLELKEVKTTTLFGRGLTMRYEPFHGWVLKELRKEKKLTQRQVAAESGIGYSTYQQLESGYFTNPSLDVLGKLGKVFGVYLYPEWPEEPGSEIQGEEE